MIVRGFVGLGWRSFTTKSLEILDPKENFTRAREREARTLSRSVSEEKWRNKPVMYFSVFLRGKEPEMLLGQMEGTAT